LSTHEPVEEVAIAQIVSNSGPSPHVSASAIAYCDELALQLIARAKKLKGDGDTAGEAAFTDSFYKALRNPPGPIDLASADYPVISCLLRNDPRAQARLAAIVQYTPSKWLLEQEMKARGFWPPKTGESTDIYEQAHKKRLNGICFSGGGIRSATFNLGVLQGLAVLDKLNCFDYLSTVSGGGYIHQFFASWVECENLKKVQDQLKPLPASSPRTVWPDPLRWLRRYSNYLTPSKGLLTTDTWSAISIWLRNTMLNQIVLISALLLVLLLPHFHFMVGTWVGPWLLSFPGQIVCGVSMIALFAYASKKVRKQMELVRRAGSSPEAPTGFGASKAIKYVFLPILLAAFIASPFVYHSAFWNGTYRVYEDTKKSEKTSAAVQKFFNSPESSRLRALRLHYLAPRHTSSSGAFLSEPTGMENLRIWQTAFSFTWWLPSAKPDSTSIVFCSLLLGIAFVMPVLYAAIPPRIDRGWLLIVAFIGVLGVGFLLLNLARLAFFYLVFFVPPDQVTRLGITVLPTLVLTVMFVSFDLAIGLIGNAMADADREWLARFRALSFLGGFGWLGIVGCSLLGPWLVNGLLQIAYLRHAVWLGWVGTTVASVLAGKSAKTSGSGTDKTSGTFSPMNILIAVGPPVFIAGLMLLLSWVLERMLLSFESQAHTEAIPQATFFALLGIITAIACLFGWRVDINDFSMHAFYRDRVARCYAGASNPDRRPNPFTGFAASDHRVQLVDLLPALFSNPNTRDLWAPDRKNDFSKRTWDVKSESSQASAGSDLPLKTKWYQGPFPIFCTTINLSFGEDLAYQERKAAAFSFTPLYCGYDVGWTEATSKHVQFNGFARTRDYAYPENWGPSMATAVAASGAALSPNWGFHTNPAMAFLLTMFNARLGWWIRNPRYRPSRYDKISAPRFGLLYLLRELFGMVNDNAPYIYLTDGGHFENMGLYELVRRRCTNIVICDAEEDGDLTFQGIGMAIRKCRIDFGAEIDLDLSKISRSGESLSSPTNFIEGTITYPNNFQGNILYIKSIFTPGLPPDLVNYRREHPAFPDDTTLNQWFTESQFESYRRLGHFTIVPEKVTESPSGDVSDAISDVDSGPSAASVRGWLERLTPRA
jgi:hypothetical protein